MAAWLSTPIRLAGALAWGLLIGLLVITTGVQAGFVIETPDGESLDIRVTVQDGAVAGAGNGMLFVWLDNQYAERTRPDEIAQRLAQAGATVWQVDLLDSLFLARSAEAIRGIAGEPIAEVVEAALAQGYGPVVLVAEDRMSVPLLRGLRALQTRGGDLSRVAGGVLFFPNLYRGTPIAGEEPELLGIVAATNMPIMIVQPELGTNRSRLDSVLQVFRTTGAPAYTWIVPDVRDYYLLQTEQPMSEGLETLSGPVPEEVERAIDQTPARLISAARLLAAGPRPATPVDIVVEDDAPVMPAFGIVERPVVPAPDFVLDDAHGRTHRLDESQGRITLVNFWASWCPPCVHEIPSMNRLAGSYDERDFAIVSINFKEEPEHILAFMERVEVDFPVLMDRDGAVSADYGVFAFPSSFILDHERRIRYSVNTAIEWDVEEVREVIDRLLAERGDATGEEVDGQAAGSAVEDVADPVLSQEMEEIVRNPSLGLYKAYAEFKMANYAFAREIWLTLAQRGVAEAWFNLGILAEDGLGERVDPALAIERYRRGAEGGSAKAQFRLAQVYLEGRIIEPDRVSAVRWLEAAAEAGYEDAAAQLTQLALGGDSDDYLAARMLESEGRLDEAISVYRRLADAGSLRARTRLAWLYEAGRGVERDLARAAVLFRSAAEAGDAEAQFALAVMLETGTGQEADPEEALAWLRRAAAQGYPEARQALAARSQ